jgi:hypothetical protein
MSAAMAAAMPRVVRTARKRRWGYLVWVIAAIVIVIPELTAAAAGNVLPFTTISTMVGHLERHHPWVELLVVAGIVFVVFSMVKVSPRGEQEERSSGEPQRTPGGRLTVQTPEKSAAAFDEEEAPGWFAVAALGSLAGIAVATWAASWWWDDGSHYRPAYVLYGLLAVLWLVVPSVYAFLKGKDPPFPTLFRSVGNLEDWLRARTWPHSLGRVTGWLVGYVILAGLVILLLHLTLYPYPDITHILNPNG